MTCPLEATSPPERVFRLGRAPDPWGWKDWSYAHSDGTFGNRWDDPASEYRVLYASSQRLACFMETIGRFPKDPALEAELNEIELERGEVDHGVLPGHLVVRDWVRGRMIGEAAIAGNFAAIGTSASLAYLHDQLAGLLEDFGLEELDASAIRAGHRELTQALSRILFVCSTEDGKRQFDGIRYLSRYGDEFENWAVFEPAEVEPGRTDDVDPVDPDLIEAARRLNVTLR